MRLATAWSGAATCAEGAGFVASCLPRGRSGLPCWPVSYQDGVYQVTDSDGILYPITLGRRPLTDFNAGWHPVGLQTSLQPFHLLELRHDDHHDAVWYLNEELEYVASSPLQFTPEQTTLVVSNLSPLLRDVYDQTLCAPAPAVAESTHTFDGINPQFVRELIGFVVEAGLSPPDVVAAQHLDSVSAHYAANGVRLSASLLRHSLDVTAPGPADPDPRHGAFSAASPFDATLLFAQEQFVPEGGALAQACRFRDPVGQLTFYLLFQPDGAPALYIPVMNTVFATRDGLSGAVVMTALLSHYACHTDRVVQAALPDAAAPPEKAAADAPPVEPLPAPPVTAAGDDGDANLVRDDPARHPPSPESPVETRPANWWKRLFGLGHP